jgi:hypothetical protein
MNLKNVRTIDMILLGDGFIICETIMGDDVAGVDTDGAFVWIFSSDALCSGTEPSLIGLAMSFSSGDFGRCSEGMPWPIGFCSIEELDDILVSIRILFATVFSDNNEGTLCNFVSLLFKFGSDVVFCSLSIVAKINKASP